MILFSIILLILAILGAPLFTIIATSAMLGFQSNDTSLLTVPLEFMSIAQVPVLTAIPLFTFAGYLLSECEAPQRLVRVTRALFGWMPGGLAIVCLVVCALFTAFTGASGVTIIALGAILYPALVQDGYSDRFTLGLVTSSGSLGLLFAPSLPLILYGVVAQVSIDDLFRAGIVPGILMIIALSMYSMWQARGIQRETVPFSGREVVAAMREAIWELPLPIVVLGGIYSGFFAVSEAAAISALYVFVAEVLINREIALRDLPRIIRESMVLVGAILMILGMSLASTYYMIDMEIPQKLLALVGELFSSQVTFLILLLIFLLILGAILDIFSAIALVVPLILPIASTFGVKSSWQRWNSVT
ncbi:MAG: TRAP transporter large permease subunit [Woeseiaceae bacterium]